MVTQEWKVYGLLRHSPMGIQKEKQNLSLRPFPPPHYKTKTGDSSFRMRSEEYLLRVERLGSIWVFRYGSLGTGVKSSLIEEGDLNSFSQVKVGTTKSNSTSFTRGIRHASLLVE